MPNLDDKTFDQLAEMGRNLIPRYAAEWTDHNLTDPGITLMELFAWLTEAMLYRINLIQNRHRLKYLKLLGFKPEPRRPAKVDLIFESEAKRSLAKGQAVYTEISGEKVYFELDEDIEITPVTLARVIVDELTGVFDRTHLNEQGDLFYPPFGLNIQEGCALYLGFRQASDTLTFMCYLYENDLIKPGAHGAEPDFPFENSRLQWQISGLSGTKKIWKQISAKVDGTEGFKKSGRLIFENIQDWAASTIPIWKDPEERSYYWLRCVVEESEFEYPPRIHTLKMNSCPATHGRSIRESEEWTCNGLPWQVLRLKNAPVLDRTLDLSVNGVSWHEVDDFDGSGPEDQHFILDREKGEIGFGDGWMGKVPPDGSKIKVAQYRIGGGRVGNIRAKQEWILSGSSQLKINNDSAARGGTDAETIEEATLRLLEDLHVPYPAVTSSDFEYIAINTPGLRIAKAKAIPNYDPKGKEGKGAVTVAVIPYTPVEFLVTPPRPSNDFLNAICHHLEKHRLLGTEVQVVGALYVKVQVSLQASSTGDFPEETLRSIILEHLYRFLHPVKGGRDGDGWPLGRSVYQSEIYELLEGIEGVDCVFNLLLSGDQGASLDSDENLILPSKIATVYSGSHTVTIITKKEECRKER